MYFSEILRVCFALPNTALSQTAEIHLVNIVSIYHKDFGLDW